MLWPVVALLGGLPPLLLLLLLLLLLRCLRIRRHTRGHIVAELTVRGRGLYFSRTPDGDWWRLRLRRRCTPAHPGIPPGDPPAAGTREPRRPRGPRPLSAAARR